MQKNSEELIDKIKKLKEREKAIILAHNYQLPEIQDIADFVGDSLELSLKATQTEAKIIVFCGVDFMAETAAILNPDKKVLIPDRNALCPMASMLPSELLRIYKKKYPKAKVVLYVNTLASAKALCDAVCTSANPAEVINMMDSETVLFGPDWNLAYYAKKFTDKRIIPIPEYGFCPVHKLFNKSSILEAKRVHPNAEAIIHPECNPDVQEVADFIGSTSKMCKRVLSSSAKEFIVATEIGILHRLRKEREEASFIPAYEGAICVNMKLHTLEKLYLSLKNEKYVIRVPSKIAESARKAVEVMLKAKKS